MFKALFLMIFFVVSSQADTLNTAHRQIVVQFDKMFRSSQRHIPADLLFKIADGQVGQKEKLELASLTREELLAALSHTPNINKGAAENILKLHQIYVNCQGLCQTFRDDGEYVEGLPRDLDEMLKGFKDADDKTTRVDEFDFIQYEFNRMIQKFIADNDLYNIRQSAGYFARDDHKNTIVSASLFARGKKHQPYMISAGQEQILHLIQNIRFTEREIRFFQENPTFQDVPKEFWDYLRDFKFTGDVKMMPVGTMLQPNEPAMIFTGNPIEIQLIETLIIPIMNYAETVATTGVKIIEAANGKPVADGGARRAPFPTLAAYVAYLSGAVGTANSHVARLTQSISNIKNFGTMAHAWVTHFDNEVEAFVEYLKFFNRPGANTLLVDTYDIERGIRNAIRAAGRDLQAVRLDSTIAGLNKVETAKRVNELLNKLGYGHVKVGYSDGITETELKSMEDQGILVDTYLVGTQFASPKAGIGHGWVYKKVEVQTTDKDGNVDVTYPIKLAPGKKGIPGADIQVYRVVTKEGIFKRDVIGLEGEKIPLGPNEDFFPLLTDVMKDGIIEDMPSIEDQRAFIKATMSAIPAELKEPGVELGAYEVKLSAALQARQDAETKKKAPSTKNKAAVFLGSFDPVTQAHIDIVNKAIEMGDFSEVYIVPTGDSAVHGKTNFFTKEEKVAMLKKAFKNNSNVIIRTDEVDGESKYSVDTLARISEDQEKRHGDNYKMTVIGGEDLFETLPTWKDAQKLVEAYSWMIFPRNTSDQPGPAPVISLPPEMIAGMQQLSPTYILNGEHTIEIVDLPLPALSSTQVRDRIQGVTGIFHQVDVQETFWRDRGDTYDGALAVPGSLDITENVRALSLLANMDDRVKQTASVDAHLDVEVADSRMNGEFHAPMNFPPHGMKGGHDGWIQSRFSSTGPAGNQRIDEVLHFKNVVTVPHHETTYDSGTFAPDGLRLVPFDMKENARQMLDPRAEVVFEKNGPASYDVWRNPRFKVIHEKLNPEKKKPIYIYGVATDFCVHAAVVGFLAEGYQVYIVEDAIAGVFEDGSKEKLAEMVAAGASLVTTSSVLEHYGFNYTEAVSRFPQKSSTQGAYQCKSLLN